MDNLQFIRDKVLELKWTLISQIHRAMFVIVDRLVVDQQASVTVSVSAEHELIFRVNSDQANIVRLEDKLSQLSDMIASYSAVFKDFYPLHMSTYTLHDFIDNIYLDCKTNFARFCVRQNTEQLHVPGQDQLS